MNARAGLRDAPVTRLGQDFDDPRHRAVAQRPLQAPPLLALHLSPEVTVGSCVFTRVRICVRGCGGSLLVKCVRTAASDATPTHRFRSDVLETPEEVADLLVPEKEGLRGACVRSHARVGTAHHG